MGALINGMNLMLTTKQRFVSLKTIVMYKLKHCSAAIHACILNDPVSVLHSPAPAEHFFSTSGSGCQLKILIGS